MTIPLTDTFSNQYMSRTVPGYADVQGAANSSAEVTVQSSTGVAPAYRKGEYFRAEVHLDNIAGPVWLGLTNLAILRGATTNVADIVTTNTGFVLVPQRQQTFSHDADGNLTNDSVWSYTWDAENRLVGMDGLAALPTGARQSLRFTFDSQGRRISKVVSNWTGSAWSKASEQRFVYDGWNLLAILGSQLSLLQSFVWGLDLSGTPQGAGGVGGLLAVSDATNGVHFTCFDGNGNISALVSATNGSESARYEYSPFGQVLRATGPMAKPNQFRFSTKYQDNESDFLYYGYRSYNPSSGRWLSRDPIGERGGQNLYGFVGNAPLSQVDYLGLACTEYTRKDGTPMIFFDNWPGNQWKLSMFDFRTDGTYDSITIIKGWTAEWEAKVHVYCCCNGKFESRQGTRRFSANEEYDAGSEFYVYKPGGGPVGIRLNLADVYRLAGQITAAVIKTTIPTNIGLLVSDANRVAAELQRHVPTLPTDGSWVGGSPCK